MPCLNVFSWYKSLLSGHWYVIALVKHLSWLNYFCSLTRWSKIVWSINIFFLHPTGLSRFSSWGSLSYEVSVFSIQAHNVEIVTLIEISEFCALLLVYSQLLFILQTAVVKNLIVAFLFNLCQMINTIVNVLMYLFCNGSMTKAGFEPRTLRYTIKVSCIW